MNSTSVYSTRFKVVAALVLMGVVAAFVLAYLSTSQGDDDPILRSGGAEDYVEALIPARNSRVPQQARIGIDLVTGWNGVLVLNDTEIPADELTITRELGLVEYAPGEGKTVEELAGGQNCVTAIVWPLSEGREQGARNVAWCFEAV